jgi:hypothetical protein
VIFFTPAGADVPVARRAFLASFRLWVDASQRLTASSRLALKDLSEVSRADTGSETRVPQSRLTKANAWPRRIMVSM